MPLVNAADFSTRIEQELARAQRYCLYLSLLVLDFEEFTGSADQTTPLPVSLTENLEAVLRCSDLVALPQGNRLAILLVETPATGMAVVAERIRDFVHDYLEGQTTILPASELPIHAAVYPDTSGDFGRLLASLRIHTQLVN